MTIALVKPQNQISSKIVFYTDIFLRKEILYFFYIVCYLDPCEIIYDLIQIAYDILLALWDLSPHYLNFKNNHA